MENKFNNIDDLFKQQANNLPDDTKKENDDWNAMMALLVVIPAGGASFFTRFRKGLFFTAIVASVASIALVYFMQSNDKQDKENTQVSIAPQPKPYSQLIDSTVPAQSKKLDSLKFRVRTKLSSSKQKKQQIVANDFKPDTVINVKRDLPVSMPDDLSLEYVYSQLQVPTQNFSINNKKDTTITALAGTKIAIPANVFNTANAGNGSINIQVREFYKYSDMIAERLSTTNYDKQLVTGGMIYLQASQNDLEIALKPNTSILLQMPTKAVDKDMQLFRGQIGMSETTDVYSPFIEWIPVNKTAVNIKPYRAKVKVFNLKNRPQALARKGDVLIAKFEIYKDCPISKEQMRIELQKRYPEYGKIKVKRLWKKSDANFHPDGEDIIGDSISITATEADRLQLWRPGQKEEYIKKQRQDSLNQIAAAELAAKQTIGYDYTEARRMDSAMQQFSFSVQNLGWINCDKFYNDPRPKTMFVIDIGMPANLFASHLVFTKFKSIMNGYNINGDKVAFSNIPIGEEVKFVSVGVKDKKIVSCVKTLIIGKQEVKDIEYKELQGDISALKKQLQQVDLP